MTDTDALVERLRERVRYGDARLLDSNGHDPLSMQAADTIAAQAARIEALEKADQWLPIESAPKDGTPVLLWGLYCSHPTVAAFSHGQWICRGDGIMAIESQGDFGTEYATFEVPSHWRPLSTPPEAK